MHPFHLMLAPFEGRSAQHHAQLRATSHLLRTLIVFLLLISLPCTSFALPTPRIFIVPPVGDQQSQSIQIGKRLSKSLREYLKKSKRLNLEDGKAKQRESKDGRLMEAESIKVSSIDLYKEGKYQEASQGFVSAIKGFQKSVSSIRDMKSIYQTLYYAAATSMALEYDDDAKDYLRQLAAISPEGEFEVQVPKKVMKKYAKERKRLLRKKRGAIQVETAPPGAKVWVNGEERCVSPCEIKNLPRGVHYIWAKKDGVGKAGSVSKVKAGWSSPIKYDLTPSKKTKSTEPVPAEILIQITERLDQAKVDRQLKEYLDVIGEEQEVTYAVFLYLLSKKRKVQLFSFVYDFNEKRTIAIKPFEFRANFSATRITAMKMVKEIEQLIKNFPEDQNIDGIYPPLLTAIEASKKATRVAIVPVTPPMPPVTPPPTLTSKPPTSSLSLKPNTSSESKQPTSHTPPPVLTPPPVESFKAPPKTSTSTTLLPPPLPPKVNSDDEDDDDLLASPWFWTGLSVAIVGGAATGAYFLLDSSSANQSYQSRVEW